MEFKLNMFKVQQYTNLTTFTKQLRFCGAYVNSFTVDVKGLE